MQRKQLFEFHDFDWYPDSFREIQTEVLNLANLYTGFVDAIVEPYADALDGTGATRVFDLCSGAGGPVVLLQDILGQRRSEIPRVILSDLYPSVEVWQRLQRDGRPWLDFSEAPIDATQLPENLEGDLLTIINGLHHFPEETVWAIIGSAVERGASIFIAEGFPRSVYRASAYIPSLLRALPNALRQTKGQRLSKTAAVFSVLPVFGGWDWLASALRIHEPEELLPVVEKLAPHYEWISGQRPFARWGQAVYLFGTPTVAKINDSAP